MCIYRHAPKIKDCGVCADSWTLGIQRPYIKKGNLKLSRNVLSGQCYLRLCDPLWLTSGLMHTWVPLKLTTVTPHLLLRQQRLEGVKWLAQDLRLMLFPLRSSWALSDGNGRPQGLLRFCILLIQSRYRKPGSWQREGRRHAVGALTLELRILRTAGTSTSRWDCCCS